MEGEEETVLKLNIFFSTRDHRNVSNAKKEYIMQRKSDIYKVESLKNTKRIHQLNSSE